MSRPSSSTPTRLPHAARTLRSVAELAAAGLVPETEREGLAPVEAKYAVAVTPAVAALIDRDDPHDPIARQYLPDPRELETRPEERADPIGDDVHSPLPGLVHRYPDRVLLKLVHVCAVYCRFCFRRETVGPEGAGGMTPAEIDAAVAYVRERPQIWEVIVTGGDPLVLSPRRLEAVVSAFAAIPHVKVMRWHSRLPVVAPERVTPDLAAALRAPDSRPMSPSTPTIPGS